MITLMGICLREVVHQWESKKQKFANFGFVEIAIKMTRIVLICMKSIQRKLRDALKNMLICANSMIAFTNIYILLILSPALITREDSAV